MAVGVLLRGQKDANNCQGTTQEMQSHSINVYLMEADFQEFKLIENMQ